MKALFPQQEAPRLFCLPPGVDFARCLVQGLNDRLGDNREGLAQVTLITNTRRSARAIEAIYASGPATLLPKILVVADLPNSLSGAISFHAAPEFPPLRSKLILAQIVKKLLLKEPGLAGVSATFELATSLRDLLEEALGEGVDLQKLKNPTDTDDAIHWKVGQKLVSLLLEHHHNALLPEKELRLRNVVFHMIAQWQKLPPKNPIIVAGSTGSRGTTALLMAAVSNLPQGAVIFPGFDRELPAKIWGILQDDHPQYRFAALSRKTLIDFVPAEVPLWVATDSSIQARNQFVSLALRPAPATHQWLEDGSHLKPILHQATEGITLLQAVSQRDEATAIAVCLRQALHEGKSSALITPDRNLARRVSEHLARWGIIPDDSAGAPLNLTPAGVFLRITADVIFGDMKPHRLLATLKHPLCGGQGDARLAHLSNVRDLERYFLRGGPPILNAEILRGWVRSDRRKSTEFNHWLDWVAAQFDAKGPLEPNLTRFVTMHRTLLDNLSSGVDALEPSIWEQSDGEEALACLNNILHESEYAGDMLAADYVSLLSGELAAIEIRNEAFVPNAKISIWGTLEARMQSADLIVLGGLNEGVWPKPPAVDPWLNRETRQQIGMPSPERKIGLSAHDFQIAAAAKEVVLSRAVKDGDAPTIPSRWLSRITCLLGGLGEEGKSAFAKMQARGNLVSSVSALLDIPTIQHQMSLQTRPVPCPPVHARPRRLSVTQIETLIRDPYSIYARHILKLRKLDPLGSEPTAMERGSLLHAIMQHFYDNQGEFSKANLMFSAETILNVALPWPDSRKLWLAQFERAAGRIVLDATERRQLGQSKWTETIGNIAIESRLQPFTLTAKADRIDLGPDGQVLIYDYKSGQVPTIKDISNFAKQLLLEGAMVEHGAFKDVGKRLVSRLEYLTLSESGSPREAKAEKIAETWNGLIELLAKYDLPTQPYQARIRPDSIKYEQDYDHLSRYGEWSDGNYPGADSAA